MDAFLSLFNAAQEGSFKYVYCAPGGQAAEMAQRGGDVSSAIGDFLEGRGFGTFRAEQSSVQSLDLLGQSGNSAHARGDLSSDPGAMIGHLAMDDATHVPVFVDHWTV
jgi:hypothetical protein